VGRGIGVMLGGVGQTIDPTSYLSLDVTKRYPGTPPDDMRLLIVDTGKGPNPFALGTLNNFVQLIDAAADPKGDKDNVFLQVKEGYGRKKLLGTIPVAFLKPFGDRQRFALAYEGENVVAVVDILPKPMPPTPPPPPLTTTPIALPPGFTIHGPAFFTDINSDGLADVVVGMASCTPGLGNNPELCAVGKLGVAYGDGAGAFYATPTKIGNPLDWDPAAKGLAGELITIYPNDGPMKGPIAPADMQSVLPLAVGQLNLNVDGQIDYVNAHGIYVSNSGKTLDCDNASNGYCRADEPSSGDSWSEVKVVDLNANGRADVVAISSGSRGIDFFNGTSNGVFNTFFLPTEGAPSNLAVGDFDGDLVGDIAYDSVTGKVGKVDGQPALIEVHTLFVAFGQTSGAPELPVSMGEVPNLVQLVAGSLPFLGNDAASDLVAVSGVRATWMNEGTNSEVRVTEGHDWKVGLSLGNAYRQLQEPLVFFSHGSITINSLPLASAIGVFHGDPSTPTAKDAHADLAAIVLHRTGNAELRDPPSATPFCDFAAAVWSLPATKDAVIEPPSDTSLKIEIPGLTTKGDATEKFLPIRRLVEAVPIDTDGKGAQELLIAFPTYDSCDRDLENMGAHGELLLATFDAKGQPTVKQILSTVGPNQFLLHLRVGDIDGDGKLDIVAMKPTFDFHGQVGLLFDSVVVMRGKGGGAFEDPIEVPIDGFPIDIALVNAEGDSDLEIVVVSELATADLAPALFVIDWDKSPPDPKVPFKRLLPRADASSKAGPAGSALEGPTALVGGDFDGDGVDDVAVAVAGGVRLFKGVAK
jgi:hypothetical protein